MAKKKTMEYRRDALCSAVNGDVRRRKKTKLSEEGEDDREEEKEGGTNR